ncbi:hypothetical protein ANN_18178 [Periplaneta americana]|uniref:Uncharacterized protein n=1 Tax=Periplaneta americana TaxID=6978 RepID=A0ABQ8SPH6_PERAM|nr:hypothetical protein ANN_18178 [Periplaneta americana]
MWIWIKMKHVKWTDRIRNEAVLERVGEERMMLKLIRKRKRNWLGYWLRRYCVLKPALKLLVNGRSSEQKEISDDSRHYDIIWITCRTVAPKSDCFTLLSYPTHLFYQCGHDVLVTVGCINAAAGSETWAIRRSEEIRVRCVSSDGSTRRADIIIIDRQKDKGVILDPTIRFEMHEQQPQELCREKQVIYEPCCQHLGAQYHITHWTVFGLMFGARGTIPRETLNQLKQYKISDATIDAIGSHADLSNPYLGRLLFKQISFIEMWIWRRMEGVKWTDRIRNEAVLGRVDEERMMLKLIRKRKRNRLGHWPRRNCLLKDALEEMVNGKRVRGRRHYQMIDDIKIYGSYAETKRKAENTKDWRMLGLQIMTCIWAKTYE